MLSAEEKPPEFLMDNFVDRDLKSFLMPLDLIHAVFFQPKYSIRYGFITSTSRATNCACVILTTFLVSALYYNAMHFYKNRDDISTYSIIYPYIAFAQFAISLMLLFFFNIKNAETNVIMISNIQKARKALVDNIPKNSLRKMTVAIWIILVAYCLYDVKDNIAIVRSNNQTTSEFLTYTLMLNNCTTYFFDFTMLYAIGVAKLLKMTLNLWITDFKECTKNYDQSIGKYSNEEENTKIKAYNDIIEAYNAMKISLAPAICTYITLYIFQGVNTLVLLIDVAKSHMNVTDLLKMRVEFPVLWVIRNWIFIKVLSDEFDGLYRSFYSIRVECLYIFKTHIAEEVKRIGKKVLRQTMCISTLRPFSIFSVDSTLPFNILSVFAPYVIIVLQTGLQKVKKERQMNETVQDISTVTSVISEL